MRKMKVALEINPKNLTQNFLIRIDLLPIVKLERRVVQVALLGREEGHKAAEKAGDADVSRHFEIDPMPKIDAQTWFSHFKVCLFLSVTISLISSMSSF